MKTFVYVEDYIEVITGYIDVVTGKRTASFYFGISPIISLARYDVSVLESMSDTILRGGALTERQGELALKIILKYKRQLAAKSIDISPVEEPKWKVPLRKMDYSRRLFLENDKIILKFPYSTQFIEDIRTFSKDAQGSSRWNKDTKVWEIGLTEYNLSWMFTWASANGFEISNEVKSLMTQVTDLEKTPYAIELCFDNNQLSIKNAPNTMLDYIVQHVGEMIPENLLRIVDMAPVLGFTVSEEISNAIIREFGPRFFNLINQRELKIAPKQSTQQDDFLTVIEYAEQTDRWPVVFYEPDLSNRVLLKLKQLNIDTYINDKSKTPNIPSDVKYIHTSVPIKNLDRIPLVVSSVGMVFGGDKQIMLQRAEKVVYCAADVYNKKPNGQSKVKDIAS